MVLSVTTRSLSASTYKFSKKYDNHIETTTYKPMSPSQRVCPVADLVWKQISNTCKNVLLLKNIHVHVKFDCEFICYSNDGFYMMYAIQNKSYFWDQWLTFNNADKPWNSFLHKNLQ